MNNYDNLIKPETDVWVIARHHQDSKPTSFVCILPAIVNGVYIKKDKIEYDLVTPRGVEWGESVISDEVSTDFQTLVEKMKKEWYLYSEWGD